MARATIVVDRNLVRSSRINWRFDYRGQGLGETAGDITQTVYNKLPRWVGAPMLRLHREAILTWRATLLRVEGQVNMLRVPMIDPLGLNYERLAGSYGQNGIPLADAETFSNGEGFLYEPFGVAAAAAAKGATELQVDIAATGEPIQVGQMISANDWPMAVTAVTEITGTVYTCRVFPAVREAIAVDDIIDLEAHGVFELVTEASGAPSYGQDHLARPELALREVLNR